MTHRLLSAIVLGFALVATAHAATPPCTEPTSSFELLQRAIFDRHDCNISYCHGADRQAGLDLQSGSSYASLLGDAADDQQAAGGNQIVVPGNPDESLLWLALAKKTLRRPSIDATGMPKDGLELTIDELEAVRLWILAGAPETGEVDGIADLIEACPHGGSGGADDSVANLPECSADDPTLLLPSLAADPPVDVRVFARGGKRRVEFTTRVSNTGDGPLIIQARTQPAAGHTVDAMQVILRRDGSKCARRAGTMRLSDAGNRWQYTNWNDYEVRKDDPVNGPVVASSGKPAYCLVDSDPIHPDEAWPHQYELHCTDPVGRMGISVGYKDTYSRQHPGQWIDLDTDPDVPIEAGNYYLVNVADPNGRLWEKNGNRDDNANYTVMGLGLSDPDPPRGQTPAPEASSTPTPVPSVERTVRPHPTLAPRPTREARPARTERAPRAPRPTRAPR